jgi:quercetin dioxygenase-like cupin family protein
MATSGVKCETLISSGSPAANRFRLQVRKVVMAPGDSPEHAHEDAGLCIVHNGAVEITRQGKTNWYQQGNYPFEGGHIPHTIKVPAPVAFRALYVGSCWRSNVRASTRV